MKISIADLKKAIKKIEEISSDSHVQMLMVHQLTIGFKDRYQAQVEITLFNDSNMLPKIRKDELL